MSPLTLAAYRKRYSPEYFRQEILNGNKEIATYFNNPIFKEKPELREKILFFSATVQTNESLLTFQDLVSDLGSRCGGSKALQQMYEEQKQLYDKEEALAQYYLKFDQYLQEYANSRKICAYEDLIYQYGVEGQKKKNMVTYLELSTHYIRFAKTPFFCGLMLALNEHYPEFTIPAYSIESLKRVPQKPLDNNFYIAYLQVKGKSNYGPQELLDQAYDIYENYQNSLEDEEDIQKEDHHFDISSLYNDNRNLIQKLSTPFYKQEDIEENPPMKEESSQKEIFFVYDEQEDKEENEENQKNNLISNNLNGWLELNDQQKMPFNEHLREKVQKLDSSKHNDTSQNLQHNKVKPIMEGLKSNYFLQKICDNIPKTKKFEIVKYNKRIQKRLDLSIKDYKQYSRSKGLISFQDLIRTLIFYVENTKKINDLYSLEKALWAEISLIEGLINKKAKLVTCNDIFTIPQLTIGKTDSLFSNYFKNETRIKYNLKSISFIKNILMSRKAVTLHNFLKFHKKIGHLFGLPSANYILRTSKGYQNFYYRSPFTIIFESPRPEIFDGVCRDQGVLDSDFINLVLKELRFTDFSNVGVYHGQLYDNDTVFRIKTPFRTKLKRLIGYREFLNYIYKDEGIDELDDNLGDEDEEMDVNG